MQKRRVAVVALIVMAVLLIGLVATAIAQPPLQQGGGGGQAGQRGGQRGGMRGMPGGMGMMAMMMPAAIAVEGDAVFVVKGNAIYKFDADSLELLAQAVIPEPEMPAPPPGQ